MDMTVAATPPHSSGVKANTITHMDDITMKVQTNTTNTITTSVTSTTGAISARAANTNHRASPASPPS